MSKARNYTFNISVGVMPAWLTAEVLARLPNISPQAQAVIAQTADTMGYAGAFALAAGAGSIFLPDGPNWPVIPEPQKKPILCSAAASFALSAALLLNNIYQAPEAPPVRSSAAAQIPSPLQQSAP